MALGNIGDKRALEPLINSLQDKDWNVRFKAIEALGRIGDKKALVPLTECFEDKSSNVRRKAIEVVGVISIGEKLPNRNDNKNKNKPVIKLNDL